MHTRGVDCDHIVSGGAFYLHTAHIRHRLEYTYTFQFVTAKVGVRDQDAADTISTCFNEGFANDASLQFSLPVAESFRIARRSLV